MLHSTVCTDEYMEEFAGEKKSPFHTNSTKHQLKNIHQLSKKLLSFQSAVSTYIQHASTPVDAPKTPVVGVLEIFPPQKKE